jgi:hypothetical protein
MIDPRAGHVEGCHHRVARELVHDAAPPANFGGRPTVQGQHAVRELLRRAGGSQRRVAADVGEHRGHEPFAGREDGRLAGLRGRLFDERRHVETQALRCGPRLVANASSACLMSVANARLEQRARRVSVSGCRSCLGGERAGLPRPDPQIGAFQFAQRALEHRLGLAHFP